MIRMIVTVLSILAAMLVAAPAAALAGLPPGGSFLDDDGNIHEGAIEVIAAEEITRGCNPPVNDLYCPGFTVSRGQMAAFLTRALELPPASQNYFTDDEGSVFETDINRLAEAGITKGCNPPANDRFCPDGDVTRGQMAAFLVRAFGYTDAGVGDLFVDDDGNVFATDIDRLGMAGVTKGCNPPINDRFCPGDPVLRDQMASFLTRAMGLAPTTPDPRPRLALTTVASGLSQPLFLSAPQGDSRLFVVERGGRIRIVDDGTVQSTPFLDISTKVATGGERGLLGLAFHPEYNSNGRFFVYYATTGACSGHKTVVAEYHVSAGDPDIADPSEKVILEVTQPACNHEGGALAFGPNGYLFIGTGDGGGSYDSYNNAQNKNTLLGAMLRIDIDSGNPYSIPADNPFVGRSGADEIYAMGLRNPWRFSIDGDTIYAGDVGQGDREEIDVFSATEPGLNFGWPRYEGTLCVANKTSETTCSSTGLVYPLIEHSQPGSRSITGGYVYRGATLGMEGHYFYGDFLDGYLRSAIIEDDVVRFQQDWTQAVGNQAGLASFGVDGHGELYLVNLFSGTVKKLIRDN
jgi:glucose/arabinose dehydrogenase